MSLRELNQRIDDLRKSHKLIPQDETALFLIATDLYSYPCFKYYVECRQSHHLNDLAFFRSSVSFLDNPAARGATKIAEVFLADGAPKRISVIPADSPARKRVLQLIPQAAKSFVVLAEVADIYDSLGFTVLQSLSTLALESFLTEFPKFVQDLKLQPTHFTEPRAVKAHPTTSAGTSGGSTPVAEASRAVPVRSIKVNASRADPSSFLLSTKETKSPSDQSPPEIGPSSLPTMSFNSQRTSFSQPADMCLSFSNMPPTEHSTSGSSGNSTPLSPHRSKSSSAGGGKNSGALPGSPAAAAAVAGGFEDDGMNWLIDESEIKMGGVVGVGQSALIHEATWRGQRVAVKFMKQKADKKTMENFQRECRLLMAVRTPQIVFFYGAVIIDSSLCLLLEYCARGSLEDYMKDHANEFTWERFFQFARQATEGLLCLHKWKPAIVHRDFKGQNLLLTENWQVKVSDFGLSRILDNSDTLNKVRGSYSFICPEVYYGKPFTEKSDVYSLSIVLWEMLMCVVTREYTLPYESGPLADVVMDFQILPAVAQRGVRPIIPENFPAGMSTLLRAMWDATPEKRPSTDVVLETLVRLEETYSSNKHSWDKLRKKHKKDKRFLV